MMVDPMTDPGGYIDQALDALGGEDTDFLVGIRWEAGDSSMSLTCRTDGCKWGYLVGQIELWELVADARQHWEQTHKPSSGTVTHMNVGDRVFYQLDAADVEGINQRRENFQVFNHGNSGHKHPHAQGKATGQRLASGHIAHIGNPVTTGQECAAEVTYINDADHTVNLRVLLDGSDIQWVCSVPEGTTPGTYRRSGRTVR